MHDHKHAPEFVLESICASMVSSVEPTFTNCRAVRKLTTQGHGVVCVLILSGYPRTYPLIVANRYPLTCRVVATDVPIWLRWHERSAAELVAI